MQTKLTLRIDDKLISRAKRSAKKRGKSVSQLVADYFQVLEDEIANNDAELTPIVRSLRGILKDHKIDESDYKKHLEEKYI